ncbi:MAG: hypothetical protein JWM56_176 [Candidatus Peribacteria bacterium]|nr:hypothetical protein [Candidatus Peribacteria bacterium]
MMNDMSAMKLHNTIYGTDFLNFPFNKRSWEVVLLPFGIWMTEENYSAIASASQYMGDEEYFIVDAEKTGLLPQAAILQWPYADLEKLEAKHQLGQVITHWFGRSASWGVACHEDHFATIGGDPDFMDRFVMLRGGREALRSTFLEYWPHVILRNEDRKKTVLSFAGW